MEVAQLVSVLDLGSRGRRFESCLPYLITGLNPTCSSNLNFNIMGLNIIVCKLYKPNTTTNRNKDYLFLHQSFPK